MSMKKQLTDDADVILGDDKKDNKPKPIRRMIAAEVRISDDELLRHSDELAASHEELEHLEEQRKNYNDQKKNEMASVEARINELVRKIRSKVETKEFFCECELDFDLKIKRWRDVKTGLVMKSEELSAQDYQQRLRLEENIDGNESNEAEDTGEWPEQEAEQDGSDDAGVLEVVGEGPGPDADTGVSVQGGEEVGV